MLQGHRNKSEIQRPGSAEHSRQSEQDHQVAPGKAQGAALCTASLKGFLKQTAYRMSHENNLAHEEPNCDSKHVLRHLSSNPWRNTDIREQPRASANFVLAYDVNN